jgi:hypothetical protein
MWTTGDLARALQSTRDSGPRHQRVIFRTPTNGTLVGVLEFLLDLVNESPLEQACVRV